MDYNQIIEWLLDKVTSISDAALGSFVYFLYGQVYQKKSIKKGALALFAGTVFAMYISPEVVEHIHIKIEVASFLCGLIGMRITEALIEQDYTSIIADKISSNKNVKNK